MANDEIADRDGGATGDTSDASTSSVSFSSFLTDSSSIDGVSFPSASGINATRVASAIIGSVAFALAYGVTSLIDAVATVYARLIDGIGNFVGVELIDATVGAGISAVNGVWSTMLAEFGIGAFPIALGTVIATFYVTERGLGTAREVLS